MRLSVAALIFSYLLFFVGVLLVVNRTPSSLPSMSSRVGHLLFVSGQNPSGMVARMIQRIERQMRKL
jgi:hypothetical protein